MLHVKRQQKQKAKCFTWNIKKEKQNVSCETPAKTESKMFHVEHQTSRKKNASCETPAKAEGKMFHVEH